VGVGDFGGNVIGPGRKGQGKRRHDGSDKIFGGFHGLI
jgi:hypothetical protein